MSNDIQLLSGKYVHQYSEGWKIIIFISIPSFVRIGDGIASEDLPRLLEVVASVPGPFDCCQIWMKHGPNRFHGQITRINHHTFAAFGSVSVGR